MASNAAVELDAKLPHGAGSTVWSLVQGFNNASNYQPANIGQIKYVASNFCWRLIEEGYTTNYPWTSTTNDDADCAIANIGQLKNVFSFDLIKDSDGDGLADWVETGTGIFVSIWNTGTSPINWDSNGNGISDGLEVANRHDPNSSDTNAPMVTITLPANNSVRTLIP